MIFLVVVSWLIGLIPRHTEVNVYKIATEKCESITLNVKNIIILGICFY